MKDQETLLNPGESRSVNRAGPKHEAIGVTAPAPTSELPRHDQRPFEQASPLRYIWPNFWERKGARSEK